MRNVKAWRLWIYLPQGEGHVTSQRSSCYAFAYSYGATSCSKHGNHNNVIHFWNHWLTVAFTRDADNTKLQAKQPCSRTIDSISQHTFDIVMETLFAKLLDDDQPLDSIIPYTPFLGRDHRDGVRFMSRLHQNIDAKGCWRLVLVFTNAQGCWWLHDIYKQYGWIIYYATNDLF